MRHTIRHETYCRFDSPIAYSIRKLRLTPREEASQRVEKWQVSAPARCARSVDAWGNTTHLLTLTEPHAEVHIVVSGVIDISGAVCGVLPPRRNEILPQAFLANSHMTTPSAALERFARAHLCGVGMQYAPQRLLDCIGAIKDRVVLIPAEDQPVIGAARVFERGSGTLYDQVHTFIAACRLSGLPARFVSGLQLGERATEHAWADVWMASSANWVSFDVRRSRLADSRLIRLAVGRDYLDACPMRAAHQGSGTEKVEVTVRAD